MNVLPFISHVCLVSYTSENIFDVTSKILLGDCSL